MTTPFPPAEPGDSNQPGARGRQTTRWLIITGGAVAVAVAIGAVIGLQPQSEAPARTPSTESSADTRTAIQGAANVCGNVVGEVADEGRTIILDTAGSSDLTGESDTIEDVACILGALDVPQAVIARMESTRALDGMQDAEWDDFMASWTYHPDDGMSLIVTEAE